MSALVAELAGRLALLDGMPDLGAGAPSPEDIARFDGFFAPVGDYRAPTAVVEEHVAPGPHGPVPVRVYRPADHPAAPVGLVWMHGGAFISGDRDMPEADVVARELASRVGATVVSVDYRLCHGGVHFPVPHDDVHAAFAWAATASDLLPAGAPWAIGGASAGANLALGVAQRLRDEGGPAASAVLLAYPVVHDPVPAGSPELALRMATLPSVLRFTPEATRFLNRNYLGPHPASVPYAFPGDGRLEGLPPTVVSLCEYDDLLPSGERLVADLRAAGVTVVEDAATGAPHGHLNVPGLPAALASLGVMSEHLRRTS
ncbi:alpha/beta hydrolase fold domain-containing protein [Cellulomonas sp. ICMP 17802]|uniref:alpha/beta hydrolase fold domain-containing protein n=1 Tax=Cellulomonas sp. ICMP 17802 TaxID=3239199 RepID=UPI00351B6B64